jgi:AcrR family transcriptional regulator
MSRSTEEADSAIVSGAGSAGGPAPSSRGTFRERHRQKRHQEFLETALHIVVTEGVDALTMQRVTNELNCATGSIYGYFPSKGALIAALQQEALVGLAGSLQMSQLHLAMHLEGKDDQFTALARLVTACRFWISAEQVFPQEIALCRQLFTSPTETFYPDEDEATAAVSPAMALIGFASGLFDDAVNAGALRPGDSFDRATIVLAGVTGVLLGGGLARWDVRLREAHRMADAMLSDLIAAWGADPSALAAADAIVAELAAAGHLIPLPPTSGS